MPVINHSNVKEFLEKAKQHRNGIVRIVSAANVLTATTRREPKLTLQEHEIVKSELLYDYFDINAVYDSQDNHYVKTKIDINMADEPPLKIISYAYIVSEPDGKIRAQSAKYEVDNSSSADWNGNFFVDSVNDTLVLIVEAQFEYSHYSERVIKTVNITPKDVEIEYQHTHPQKQPVGQPVIYGDFTSRGPDTKEKMSPDDGHIVVALFRYPENKNDVDYICGFGRSGGGYPFFGIPGKGVINLKNYSLAKEDFFSAYAYTEPVNEKGEKLGGVHPLASTPDVFSVQDKAGHKETDITYQRSGDSQIDYQFTTAWQNGNVKEIFEGGGGWKKIYYQYNLIIKIKTSDNLQHQILITTKDVPIPDAAAYALVYVIRNSSDASTPIAVMWGCVAKGTLIKTSDGEIPVEDIGIGDRIYNPMENSYMRVENTWRGTEEGMLEIKTGETSILVTKNHPVWKSGGAVRAQNLKVGDEILTAGKRAAKITEINLKSGVHEVYNLDVDRNLTQSYSANGLISGTNYLQNTL